MGLKWLSFHSPVSKPVEMMHEKSQALESNVCNATWPRVHRVVPIGNHFNYQFYKVAYGYFEFTPSLSFSASTVTHTVPLELCQERLVTEDE